MRRILIAAGDYARPSRGTGKSCRRRRWHAPLVPARTGSDHKVAVSLCMRLWRGPQNCTRTGKPAPHRALVPQHEDLRAAPGQRALRGLPRPPLDAA